MSDNTDVRWSQRFGKAAKDGGLSEDTLILKRSYLPWGTYGTLILPNNYSCMTVERPWLGNKPYISCIPEGEYLMKKRLSSVVSRSSGGEFDSGWEVKDVLNRTFIMIHPANVPSELEGCIAPGRSQGFYKNQWSITHSRDTFRELMGHLDKRDEWKIQIRTNTGGVLP